MSNLPHDHVHRLIHSMTRAEKRYFKLHSARHTAAGQGNQSMLFDAISLMDEYDEQRLRRKFEGEAFMRRFPITKRRLYEALLNSLDAFHSESSMDTRLHRMLHHVEILHQRALHADAAKVLRSVRSLAREHDRQAILLQVTEWERRSAERNNYSGITAHDLEKVADTATGTIQEWLEIDQLWQLKSHAFLMIYRNGQTLEQDDVAQLDSLANHPLLKEGVTLLTARARFLHHHVQSALSFARNQLEDCERHLSANCQLLKQEHRVFQEEHDLVLGVMGNLAHVRMRLGKHQLALDGFHEFKRIPAMMATAPCPDLDMKLFVMGASLELSVLATRGAFIEGVSHLPEVEHGLARFGDRISLVRRAELSFQAAYASFGAGKYDNALHWCNRILNEKGIEAHAESHVLGRMLHLMCLLELRKVDLLPYVLRNTQRSIRIHSKSLAMEEMLLICIRAWLRSKSDRDRTTCFQDLNDQLVELSNQPSGAALLDQIDILSWALSRATGRHFSAIVIERWRTRTSKKEKEKGGPSLAA